MIITLRSRFGNGRVIFKVVRNQRVFLRVDVDFRIMAQEERAAEIMTTLIELLSPWI